MCARDSTVDSAPGLLAQVSRRFGAMSCSREAEHVISKIAVELQVEILGEAPSVSNSLNLCNSSFSES